MWGPLLVLALLTTINPVRLGIILLVLSRPRPMQNLLAYWAGALIVGLATLIIPLIALHATPTSASFARDFAHPTANPTAQRTAIGIGVILLSVAALMVVRSLVRSPSNGGGLPMPDRHGNASTSTLVLDSTAPPVFSRLLTTTQDEATEGGSPVRRLLRHARKAWQNGNPWIAFVIGLVVLPPLDGVLFALAIIVASGAALGVQVGAAVAYMIGVLVIEEIILFSNVFAPAKTQAVLQRLHDWAQAHHRKFVAAILTVVGISLVVRGLGGF
ncbi:MULTISPECIES: GAP family protein [unclassified Mycolicibacterium]|uniref:GAP family protein n=1 Tax=unclassified Mycolicibacterium TaxID=2636767 RepID=UPI001F4C27C9|nr:GAP family protein [Mycolicibacterium sp. YH-1]UNB53470.1 GAP family protein [Mycolicibacterium sp. YH-1]